MIELPRQNHDSRSNCMPATGQDDIPNVEVVRMRQTATLEATVDQHQRRSEGAEVAATRATCQQSKRLAINEKRSPQENNNQQQSKRRAASNSIRSKRKQMPNELDNQRQHQQQAASSSSSTSTSSSSSSPSLVATASVAATAATTTTTTTTAMTDTKEKTQIICAACCKPIRERYLLEALDKQWHEDCLKCACCDCRLGEVGSSLFTQADKILCRRDFLRIFGQPGLCAACEKSIPPYELVMRANENAYHMNCFACQQCQYRFCVGDRFHLMDRHKIICTLCHSESMQAQAGQHVVCSPIVSSSDEPPPASTAVT